MIIRNVIDSENFLFQSDFRAQVKHKALVFKFLRFEEIAFSKSSVFVTD